MNRPDNLAQVEKSLIDLKSNDYQVRARAARELGEIDTSQKQIVSRVLHALKVVADGDSWKITREMAEASIYQINKQKNNNLLHSKIRDDSGEEVQVSKYFVGVKKKLNEREEHYKKEAEKRKAQWEAGEEQRAQKAQFRISKRSDLRNTWHNLKIFELVREIAELFNLSLKEDDLSELPKISDRLSITMEYHDKLGYHVPGTDPYDEYDYGYRHYEQMFRVYMHMHEPPRFIGLSITFHDTYYLPDFLRNKRFQIDLSEDTTAVELKKWLAQWLEEKIE